MVILDGASQAELKKLEQACGVRLPEDFKNYLSCANGMQIDDWDDNMIRFWPLQEIRAPTGMIPPLDSSPPTSLIFADYLIDSHFFALEFSANSEVRVINLSSERKAVIAGSFSEFIDLCLAKNLPL